MEEPDIFFPPMTLSFPSKIVCTLNPGKNQTSIKYHYNKHINYKALQES